MDDKKNSSGYYGVARAGLRNVGSYQVSGHPFLTGSTIGTGAEQKIEFPYVTRSVTVISSGSAELRVYFNSTGSVESPHVITNHHFLTLTGDGENITFIVRCKEIFVNCTADGSDTANNGMNGYELFAELTTIPTGSMYVFTGSGLTD